MPWSGRPVHRQVQELASLACRPACRYQREAVGFGKVPTSEGEHTTAQRQRARRPEVSIVAEPTVEPLDQQHEGFSPRNLGSNVIVGRSTDQVHKPVSRPGRPSGDELAHRTEVHVRFGDEPARDSCTDLAPIPSPDPAPHETGILFRPDGDDEHERPPNLIHLEVAPDSSEPHPKVAGRPGVLVLVAADPAEPGRE